MDNKIDILTVIIVLLAAYLLYTLVKSPDTCEKKSEYYTKKNKKHVKSTKEKKESVKSTKQAGEIEDKDAKSYVKTLMENNATPLTSYELLPSQQNGWEKYGCYTVDYDPNQSYSRITPYVENPQKNNDLQLGRRIYAIKKVDGVSPWNNSTIGRQTRGYDDDTLGVVDEDVIVVTQKP